MKVSFAYIGKTSYSFVQEACNLYFNRIKHYCKFEEVLIEDVKKAGTLSPDQLKLEEGKKLLAKIDNKDFLVLLDEKGKDFTSVAFASWIEQKQVQGISSLVFVVGGAYGFSKEVYDRANMKLQLSKMTFSHQIIRAIFAEQLYRAFTIIKGEPYHNE
ncbi:MAG: 23S rRNA (pseudouridine(1915)-N(3))-methyltransferase RlmH [Chitinophagales bacterium]|nr:23S rRNA (pseudouridine(1915)-N(3))-methyltransferase RlmH [Chitinophagales bacterium]